MATIFFRLTNIGNNCLIKNIEIDVTNSTAIQFLDEVNIYQISLNKANVVFKTNIKFILKFRKVNKYLGINLVTAFSVVHYLNLTCHYK